MEKKGSKKNLKKRPSFLLLLPSEHDHIMSKIRSPSSNSLEHKFTMPSLFLFQIFYHIKNIKQRDINMKGKIIREDNLLSYLSLYKTTTFDFLIEEFPPKILAPQTIHVILLSLSYFYHIKTQK